MFHFLRHVVSFLRFAPSTYTDSASAMVPGALHRSLLLEEEHIIMTQILACLFVEMTLAVLTARPALTPPAGAGRL